jgi:predicted ATP-binding protein involved in virulence
MQILELEIRNFKGFEYKKFNLNPNFTVIIGENASGKTSVLDALAIAIGSFLIEIEGADTRSIQEQEIRIKMVDNVPKPQKPVEITAFGVVNDIETTWKRSIEKQKTTTKDAINIRNIAKNMLAQSRTTGQTTFPLITYHGTGRLWAEHKTQYSKITENITAGYGNCLSAKSSSKEFLSWYKTMEDEIRKFEQAHDRVLLDTFKKVIVQMIPDARWQDMAYSFRDDALMGIFTDETGKKNKLSFNQLSDGYRNMIGMVADLAYRCIQLNPHLGENAIKETPGVVLIDELDLNLHPKWQRRLVDDLKICFPRLQFVATTHSPFIVQSLKSDEYIILDKISDVSPNNLDIGSIVQHLMGVESVFSIKNEATYHTSNQILSNIKNTDNPETVNTELNQITDPALRAFLALQR